ncbi:MAG: DoxX family membrane protein [Deltaproteobacteria bacterium]|nr:DoxX family membrane protein [Deltaproteobacteria bacterium]
MNISRFKTPLRYVMGALYIFAGVMHFVVPQFYVQIMPPWLPWHLELVYLSGVAEIVLGAGVLFPRYSQLSAWGIIALLVAVFPANIYMATSNVQLEGLPEWMNQPEPLQRWARLPFQAIFILWAWWYTKAEPLPSTPADIARERA